LPASLCHNARPLSFLAGNSQLVAGRIDRASSVGDLASAAQKIEPQIRMLRRQGVKIEVVCEIVSDLNRRLHAKLYSLVAPQPIREHGCLIVMGSEGRGEQTFAPIRITGSSCGNLSRTGIWRNSAPTCLTP
jgi:signal-transduction protein with cAMP-binding, CBS, and nucleotidyltransferase domain